MKRKYFKPASLHFERVDPLSTLRREVDKFILEHEPSGTLPQRPTHHFCALDKKNRILAAQILSVPTFFKKPLLGDEFYKTEKLFARGATVRNKGKNISSWLISRSVRWMVLNTSYRVFFAFADPYWNERGACYKASNWVCLGHNFGDSGMPPLKSKWMTFQGRTRAEHKKLIQAFHKHHQRRPRISPAREAIT